MISGNSKKISEGVDKGIGKDTRDKDKDETDPKYIEVLKDQRNQIMTSIKQRNIGMIHW